MPSALDRIIDGASDPTISTADLLRSAMAAAHRLHAAAVRDWAERELSGYDDDVNREDLPVYRRGEATGVRATWSGPFSSSGTTTLTEHDVSDDFPKAWFLVSFRQPASVLQTLAASQDEISIPWPTPLVSLWNSLAEQGKASTVSNMFLFSARTVVEKSSVTAVLDAIRTELLKLALDLQNADESAGEPGGATIDDPKVERVLTAFTTNVFGGSPTFAQGTNVSQVVTVNVGDVASLSQAAKGVGLSDEDLTDYVDAVLSARQDRNQSKLKSFLGKVRDGAVTLAGDVAGNIAADQLLDWATTFLGG